MNRITSNYGTKWSQAQKIVSSLFHTKIYPHQREATKLGRNPDFASNYNEETIKRILHVLNNTEEDKLSRYNISKTEASNLEKYRRSNGPFTSMEQILEVDNFDIKILDNIVSSSTQDSMKKEVKSQLKSLSNIITPNLLHKKRSAIKTVTGITFGTENISWAKIDLNDNLLAWDSHDNLVWPKKDTPMDLHDVALKVRRKLPESDVYVTDIDMRTKCLPHPASSPLLSRQQIQLTAMLSTLLATRFDSSNGNDTGGWMSNDNFYYLKRSTPASLFRLLIGNETAAARNAVDQIMDHTIHESLEYVPPLIIDPSKYELYNKSYGVKKETLSQALILSITFMQLVIKRDPRSLKAIQQRPDQWYQ